MSQVLIGGIILVVAALSIAAAGRVPSHWGRKGLLVRMVVTLGPVAFTAWALAMLGVRFAGGGCQS